MKLDRQFQLNRWALLAVVVLAGSGCANLGGAGSGDGADSIRPVEKVVHSVEESEAQYMLGKYYLGQNRTGLALAAFTQAVRHNPLNAEARNARAIALVKVGDFDAAITELETAVATSPNQAHLLNNLAYAYMLNGSLILAAENLQLALEIDPSSARARENWRELSEKAAPNPKLASRLASMLPELPEIVEPAQKETSETTPKIDQGSLNVFDPTPPAFAAVLNVDFGLGLTPAPIFASSLVAPIAVEIQETNTPSESRALFAQADESGIGPLAVDVRYLPSTDLPSGLLASTELVNPIEPLAVEVTHLTLPPQDGNLLALADSMTPIAPLAVEVLTQEPARQSMARLASVYQPPYAVPSTLAVDVRNLSGKDNNLLLAANTDQNLKVGAINFTEPMATDVQTLVKDADGVITLASVYQSPYRMPMAVDVRDLSKPTDFAEEIGAAITTNVLPSVTLTRELEQLTAAENSLDVISKQPVVKLAGLSNTDSSLPNRLGALSFDLSTVLVDVSNGNGVDDIAEVLGKALNQHKVRIWRIRNADRFDHEVTKVYYVDGHRNEALALARMLPVEAQVLPAPKEPTTTQVRIIVGKDIASLREARDVKQPEASMPGASA